MSQQSQVTSITAKAETFLIGPYEFAGPFEDGEYIEEAAGLCVVLSDDKDEYNLLEIFCTDNARKEWRRFEGRSQSRMNKNIRLAVHYQKSLPQQRRNQIIQDIMNELSLEQTHQLSFADLAGSIYITKEAPVPQAISA